MANDAVVKIILENAKQMVGVMLSILRDETAEPKHRFWALQCLTKALTIPSQVDESKGIVKT